MFSSTERAHSANPNISQGDGESLIYPLIDDAFIQPYSGHAKRESLGIFIQN